MKRALLVLALAACNREDGRAQPTTTTPPPATTPEPVPTDTAAPPDPTPPPEPVPPQTDASPPTENVATIIEVDAQAGPLSEQLTVIAARAKKEGRVAAVELWAGWCAPCKKLDKLIAAGTIGDALRGAILVRVDVDMFDDELNELGFRSPQIPSFYRVDGRGKPIGKPLAGGDWGERDAKYIDAALRKLLGT
jgi:thiol-disulfide isomerase/thioredoxin